ncbi:MAG: type III pantothenate kinase [Verrucomicrobiota bacterium]|nr:type III pantothenate kinase [Verrucomicrobiota bacterium]
MSAPAKPPDMILYFDIGNTHTHVGLGTASKILKQKNLPTSAWFDHSILPAVKQFAGKSKIDHCALASVVPRATSVARAILSAQFSPPFELRHDTVTGIGIAYPKPETIGPDRLANAVAAKHLLGAPSVVVDFGTAVTFDILDRRGNYVGGIIAPGLAVMTSYLHEKTALLPQITIRDTNSIIGKNTKQAMLIGAVHGYRGLIRELLAALKKELDSPTLPVIATGGYAKLMASKLPEITLVQPLLTLDGLRLCWNAAQSGNKKATP